jgi:hypothetical protein
MGRRAGNRTGRGARWDRREYTGFASCQKPPGEHEVIDNNQCYFYVAYVDGTNLFKIGTSINPKARKNTAWHDATLYVQHLICSALNHPISDYKKLKSKYHYVITEACSDKAAAKALECKFRDGVAAHKLFFRNGKVGDWFSFVPLHPIRYAI